MTKICPLFYDTDDIMRNGVNINPLELIENMNDEQPASEEETDTDDGNHEEGADDNSHKSDVSVALLDEPKQTPTMSSSATKQKRPMSIAVKTRLISGKQRCTGVAASNATDLVSDVTGSLKALGEMKKFNYAYKAAGVDAVQRGEGEGIKDERT